MFKRSNLMAVCVTVCVAACVLHAPAQAQPAAQKVDFILNWVPGGDHAPYYYAR